MSRGEQLPLLDVQGQTQQIKKAADILLIVPLTPPEDPPNESTIDADSLIQDMTVLNVKSENFHKYQKDVVRNTFDLCEKNKGRSVKITEARVAFLKDICKMFPKAGFQIKMFKSVDEDELFVRVCLDEWAVEQTYAEMYRLRLQTTEKVMEKLKIVQDPNKGPVSPAYMDYDREIVEEKREALGVPIFKKYYTRSAEGSIFRTVDRIRIIQGQISQVISLDHSVSLGLISSHGPVHYKDTVNELRQLWANFGCATIFNFMHNQPLDLIKNYFGETLAFYFAWSGFNVRCFGFLAIFGLVAKVFKVLWKRDTYKRAFVELGFLVIMVSVGSVYTLGWKRQENWFCALWDCKESSRDKITRADYRGDFEKDPLDENGKKIRQYPTKKVVAAKIFGVVMSIVYMCLVIAWVSYIYMWRPYVMNTYGSLGKYGISIALSLQILICNMVWRKIVSGLVWLENPRTSTQYYQAFIWKQFVFQFFNAYQSFLYFLFVGPFRGSCPVLDEDNPNPYEDCCEYTRSSLYSTFASYGFFAVLGMAQPWVMQQYALWSENRKLMAKRKKKADALKARGEDPSKKVDRSFMEQQSKMYMYDQETQVADFLELVIIAGYVLMFGVLAPMIAVIAAVFFAIRLRVDAWKLCVVYRRPYPEKEAGIGDWLNVIKTLTWIGMASNIAIICLQLKWPNGEELSWHSKFIAFFAVEHFCIFVRVVVCSLIEEESSATMMLYDRREYVVDHLIMGKVEGKIREPQPEHCEPRRALSWKAEGDVLSDTVNLVDGHVEWGAVDHDNEEIKWGQLRSNLEDCV